MGFGRGSKGVWNASVGWSNGDAKPDPRVRKTWLKRMGGGEYICQRFQLGKCPRQRDKQCNNGKHVCATEIKPGIVCGRRHAANDCNRTWERACWRPEDNSSTVHWDSTEFGTDTTYRGLNEVLPIFPQNRIAHELILTFEGRSKMRDIPLLEDIMNSYRFHTLHLPRTWCRGRVP